MKRENCKPEAFRELVVRYRMRMETLRGILDVDGRILAFHVSNPTHSIFLTRGTESVWRVTSFHGIEAIGHREYDRLDGGGPTQNALSEFASHDVQIIRLPMPQRVRERKIKEAEEGHAACEGAIRRAPDESAKAVFERSRNIWKRRLDPLKPSAQ